MPPPTCHTVMQILQFYISNNSTLLFILVFFVVCLILAIIKPIYNCLVNCYFIVVEPTKSMEMYTLLKSIQFDPIYIDQWLPVPLNGLHFLKQSNSTRLQDERSTNTSIVTRMLVVCNNTTAFTKYSDSEFHS